MAQRKKLIPRSNPRSLIQWNEGGGEYEVTCPRCKDELSAPTLKTIKTSFKSHYATAKCKAHY